MTSTIPWPSAVKVASRIAGTYPLAESYHSLALAAEAPRIVRRAAELVQAETGLVGAGIPEVAVTDRPGWIERNLAFFSAILQPAEEAIARRLGTGADGEPVDSGLVGSVVAAEMGALLGVLSRRVLGQYELVLPSDDSGDVIYLVAPNILSLEREHQFKPSEFRFWLALHEATHRAQFVGVPWMQDYFFTLVQDLVATAKPEPGRLSRLISEMRSASAEGRPVMGETGLLGVFASPDQRHLLDRVQALMSLLEGHGHVVMDRIGARTLVTQQRMSNLLKARRKDPRMAAFMRITGMDMKMKQYELGEKFVKAVERRADWATLDAAWEGPELLPTRSEIEDPESWLRRIG